MLTCKDSTQMVSEGLDRELPLYRRLGLRFHLLMCGVCRAYARQLRVLDALVRVRFREAPPPLPEMTPPALPPDARERLKQALESRE